MSQVTDVVHHVPGRLRLRIPGTKANPGRLQAIRESLEAMAGVRQVAPNARLGSLVVQYDPALFSRFLGLITEYASARGLFLLACDEEHPCVSEADRSIDRVLGDVNQAVHAALGGVINLKELLPLFMGAYGLFFVDKTAAAAQWINWMQVALDTYMDLHEDQPIQDLSHSMQLLGAQILARQTETIDTMRSELAALREEVRALAGSPPRG